MKNASLLVLIFILFNLTVFGQSKGNIKGKLIDTSQMSNVGFSNITVNGTTFGTTSNANGEFEIENLPIGSYTLTITSVNYNDKVINKVLVSANQTNNLGEILMIPKIKVNKKTTISAVRKTNSIKAAIQDVKKAEVVVSAISSEQISKSQDNDAAKAAARVPGVTLMENRFIILRGLSQRYNSVQINNINAPSTEVDRRTFSFDLVPSNMLDKIMIYKSGASDLAGDFAGGVIKLTTKNNIEKDYLNVSFGFGYRVGTSFQTHAHNNVSGSTDLLGFDNGNRAMPSTFPISLNSVPNQTAIRYAKDLNNNYSVKNTLAPLDFGFGLSYGKNIRIKKMKLFAINSFGYSTNYQYANMKRNRYQNDQMSGSVIKMFDFNDANFAVESKINALSNWILNINKNNSLSFKNMFNQIGENETTIREGVMPTERPSDEFKNYAFHYTSRSIYNTQMEGLHKLNEINDKLTYSLGFGFINRNEPDYRRFRTYRIIGSESNYKLIDPPSASLFDAARFYSNLKENTKSVSVNYEKNLFNYFDTSSNIVLKVGAYGETKNRNFDARWLSYVYTGNTSLKDNIISQPIDQLFSEQNINTYAGFKIAEGTNPNDKYSASNKLLAGYISATLPFNKLKMTIGARTEYFSQLLNSKTTSGPIEVRMDSLNVLPSINTSYNFSEKKLIRAAYYKTINRPEFRELAPFVYYDFMYDVNIVGNPNLKTCSIDNLDLRYEYYPSTSETISVGGFYKKFINPIESYVQPVGLSQQYTLNNASKATNYGVELEIRRSFDNLSKSKIIKNMSAILNASYIYSQVDLGNSSSLSQARTRALQGQSPYIVNSTIAYNDEKKKLNLNVSYNVFGKRIAFVGNDLFPTVYEMPRHSVDISISKEINSRLNFKVGVSDLLNYKSQMWQDTDGNNFINYKNNIDKQLLSYRRGQMINFNFTYKIFPSENKKISK